MDIKLFSDTRILASDQPLPVLSAAADLARDLRKCCFMTTAEGKEKGEEGICAGIRVRLGDLAKECFRIFVEGEELVCEAVDDLGAVYGLYHISRELLGVQDFWFWNDQRICQKPFREVDRAYRQQSAPFSVRLRGWFINDEVLLHTWKVERRAEGPWEMALEALLRCGGNMVIPGTDKNARKNRQLVFSRGLYLTHHHAEPLGAEMFARAYPDLVPSYDRYSDRYQKLWEEAVREQQGQKVVWNIGFRGQGDVPFWEDDPSYDTPAARGELIGRLIRQQYDLVKRADPEAVCCTNLYGETMELYQEGFLKLPEDVIHIWADNGFGKMVTRRQGDHDPRIPAMPEAGHPGRHGIYYHVSFYDLQAANHITMLPNAPEFVRGELLKVLERGMGDYWLVNCSNIKPHVYYLDFLAELWRTGDVDIEGHLAGYIRRYYDSLPADGGSASKCDRCIAPTLTREAAPAAGQGEIVAGQGELAAGQGVSVAGQCEPVAGQGEPRPEGRRQAVAACFRGYFRAALAYGPYEDSHAGEQFANHVCRIIVSQYMRDRTQAAKGLRWATEADTLEGQIRWYKALCWKGLEGAGPFLEQCERTAMELEGDERVLFEDSLLLQARIYAHCYAGACFAMEGLERAMEGDCQRGFYLAGKGREGYLAADLALRSREHGKWRGFYANECLTDIKQTAWLLKSLMGFIRNLEDGPHFYQWQRTFADPEEDRRVMLILNMDNHMGDEEIFGLMEERWG